MRYAWPALFSMQSLRRLSCGRLKQHVIHDCQSFFHDVHTTAELFFIDDERRADPQHIKSAECIEMLALQVRGELAHLRATSVKRRQGFARCFFFHEFQNTEESLVPNVTDATVLLLDRFKASTQIASLPLDVGKNVFFFVDPQ